VKLNIFRCLILVLLGILGQSLSAQDNPFVEFNELPGAVSNNVVSHLALANESCDMSERRRRTLADTFDLKIDRALRALGYYQSNWQYQIDSAESCWKLSLEITLGEPVLITSFEVQLLNEIEQDLGIQRFLSQSSLPIGSQLNHREYERFKTSLISQALSAGYIEGRFVIQQMSVEVESNSANIKLHFDSGPRYKFGPVSFVSESFDEEYLSKYQPFVQGQPFEAGLIGEFRQGLINTRIFSDVSVREIDPDTTSLEIPIEVVLVDVSRYVTSIGAGAATDTGPRASLSFEDNRLNRRGHKYRVDLAASAIESSVDFNYQIPLSNPGTDRVNIKAGWISEDTGTAENEIWFVGTSRSRLTSSDWLQTLDLTYQVESYRVGSDVDSSNQLIPSISWHRSTANNLAYPTSGLRLQGSVRGAQEGVISSLSFLQVAGSIKYIHGLGSGRVITRLEGGSTFIDDASNLPASLRFFAGGDSSVRGFDYKALGPTNSTGEVIGGKHLLVGSIEYEHPIFTRSGLAVFYDVGNAFDDSNFVLENTVGIGYRWRSPLGPIRVDFGFPQGGEDSFRVHLSMGPDL
jgi:translocation and assembly module TamA